MNPNGSVILTIEVVDVDAMYGLLTGPEVNVLSAPRDEPWGQRHFFAQDPGGYWVDIVQSIAPNAEYSEGYAASRRRTNEEWSAETRTSLLRRRVFEVEGYDSASIERIASAAHVTKGAVYHHYKDKRALFRGCVRDRGEGTRTGDRARCPLSKHSVRRSAYGL